MTPSSCVGINIGALTVKIVALRRDGQHFQVVSHQGSPLQVLQKLLAEKEFAAPAYYGVSGNLGHISEVAAIQRAARELPGTFDAIASLGGESFLIYFLVDGKITNVLSHNKCAAGSGEFLSQQIGRMGLNLEEAIRRSFAGKVVPLASRCSVHCKSDITHKLNRHEALPEDILRTLHDSMADKVVSLLEKGQRTPRRVLVIGGVSQNRAMLAALRGKMPDTEFIVLPESPCFEAWGCALLTRDDPIYLAPNISPPPNLNHLPPLQQYSDRVQLVPASPPKAPSGNVLVLGVDAGSTTTKAVLLDPATRAVVASHYTRTHSDPLAATRECLRALAAAGHSRIGLVATTGSARELVGAYLGAAHVYNEISAHAAGAAQFDPEVETIFEIGGQDAKYIFLRHGVAIDYVMNDVCSAGTGSFLEESARGDLGIAVADIAPIALAAPAPVRFKATCAAFINSDIRLAQQQGATRENIVAGLVYAIADNYLIKVKGPRPVGKKVFLQGGVALNRAVGFAFAQSVGRPVIIPPNPELLGAMGVALLALERSGGAMKASLDLLPMAAPEIQRVGRFTCRACQMNCTIDRFEVAGRRFPFGGRCSLFENVWKRQARITVAPDLVAQRAALILGPTAAGGRHDSALRVGIPRALTTHSLYPLYASFFAHLGMETILSGVDAHGDLKAYSGFCFPAQVAHGALLDLTRQGVDWVFLPHVMRMPQASECHDSYLCPITQASSYFLAKAFPALRFLSPLLDFTHGYAANTTMADMAVGELDVPSDLAQSAWQASVLAQTEAERGMRELGQRALEQVLELGTPAILLAGRSYNAYAPEASQSVGKKLSSMGVMAIPADCLAPVGEGPTAWHFSNQILNAMILAKRHPNLFLLCVSNFSCTVDAFAHAMVASEMGSKPYMILEVDAHTADAGVQTRLEAFLDIICNYAGAPAAHAASFTPCRLGAGGLVIRGNGERVSLKDPRVKLYLPAFSKYHSQAMSLPARWLGLHAGKVLTLDRSQLHRGLQHTSGRECLPLPVCLGQLLEIHERRQPGEISGFFMMRGGAPCLVDAYMGFFERFIAEQKLNDLFLFVPGAANDYCGFDLWTWARHLSPSLLVADIMVEIENVLHVVGAEGSMDKLAQEWERFLTKATTLDLFHAGLPRLAERLKALPRHRDPLMCPRVVVTGDFFTRFSPLFMEGVRDLYARRGIILKPVDLSDLALYVAHHSVTQTASSWGMKPGGFALAKACARIFQEDGKAYLQNWLACQAEIRSGDYYRGIFRKSGLLVAGPKDISDLFEKAAQHLSPTIFGEAIPTVGDGLKAGSDGYDGIIIIGPFNCLPFRISEAILKPLSLQQGMPVLAYESDGYAVSPSVLRQVEVHIQQVLDHATSHPAAKPPASWLDAFSKPAKPAPTR